MSSWIIDVDDPRKPEIVALLERHLAFARSVTPPEDVHALDLDGLLDPSVIFYSLRQGEDLLGIGAIKQLQGTDMELKSIHTAEEVRGRGIGRAVVEHLLRVARERGAERVFLETGSMDVFAPSRALYESVGFVKCGPFDTYVPSRSSTFMTMDLGAYPIESQPADA
jgi:putative acetyltransferase